ncbi:MAG: hypothetical protein ACFE8P_12065 [Promethearchaeota archaeon]
MQGFAVKSSSGIQRFENNQIIEVPRTRIKDLNRKGLVLPLVISPSRWNEFASCPLEVQ